MIQPHKKTYILLIEDDDAVSFLLAIQLKEAGFKCRQVFTVSQAKVVLESPLSKVDLVITDYTLPDGTAKDILPLCTCKNIPVIGISGEDENEQWFLENGASGFLAKPFEVKKLLPFLINFMV